MNVIGGRLEINLQINNKFSQMFFSKLWWNEFDDKEAGFNILKLFADWSEPMKRHFE